MWKKIQYHSVFWPIMENEIFEIIILAFFMALLDRLAEEWQETGWERGGITWSTEPLVSNQLSSRGAPWITFLINNHLTGYCSLASLKDGINLLKCSLNKNRKRQRRSVYQNMAVSKNLRRYTVSHQDIDTISMYCPALGYKNILWIMWINN